MHAEAPAAGSPLRIALILGAVGALGFSVLLGAAPTIVAPLAGIFAVVAAWHQVLLRWHNLLAAIVAIVLFVPIKRYELPATLPFELELYRVAVALVVLCWASSLLIDRRVVLRRSPFDAPLLVIAIGVLASALANPARVQSLSSEVAKALTFFLSFLLLYLFVSSVIRTRAQIDRILKLLVAGGAIVAIASIVERRNGYNVFYHLSDVFPFLEFQGADFLSRSGRLRVFGSAQHPIALGALLAALLPIGFGLGYRAGRRWWIPTVALALGAFATASRTPIVMLVVATLVFIWLRPLETRRLWPIALPAIVVVHALLPGTIGTLRSAFFPPGGLVAEQTTLAPNADPLLAGGRLRLLGPSLDTWSTQPVFGQGFGTRLTGFDTPKRNAPILDNQWLATLLEVGLVGFLGWVWLAARAVRRLGRASRDGPDGDSWRNAAFAAAIASFLVGMFTYDAFSFIQVTFVFWVLLGLAAVALRLRGDEPGRRPSES